MMSKLREVALTVALSVAITLAAVWWFRPGPAPVVTQQDPNTTNITHNTDNLTPKEVIKYVQDDAEVKRLLDENRRLNRKVTLLSETIATFTATGSGEVTIVPSPTPEVPVPTPTPTPVDPHDPASLIQPGDFVIRAGSSIKFTDFRLNFTSDGRKADYTLTQKFEILQASGRDAAGKPVNTVKLFEIGPGETRTPVTDLTTTNVIADDTRSRWRVGLTMQAGVGYTADTIDQTKKGVSAVAGVQWLKRGRTEAAEDSTLSLLTPVVTWTAGTPEVGILPVSFNAGRIKHQPFKDLWLSPYVGWSTDKGKVGRLGVFITASF